MVTDPSSSAAAEAARRRSEDRELVRRVAAGDQVALSELYDRFSGMLLALAQRVLADPADAEETLQEAFLQAWKQAGRYDPARSSVSTWLVLITRSRAIDLLRSRGVKERTRKAAIAEKGDLHTSPEGPTDVLLLERRNRLERELGLLPEEQREVLEMSFFRGMTQREISEQTGIPLGTVKTRTLLAMKKLRVALKNEIEELL